MGKSLVDYIQENLVNNVGIGEPILRSQWIQKNRQYIISSNSISGGPEGELNEFEGAIVLQGKSHPMIASFDFRKIDGGCDSLPSFITFADYIASKICIAGDLRDWRGMPKVADELVFLDDSIETTPKNFDMMLKTSLYIKSHNFVRFDKADILFSDKTSHNKGADHVVINVSRTMFSDVDSFKKVVIKNDRDFALDVVVTNTPWGEDFAKNFWSVPEGEYIDKKYVDVLNEAFKNFETDKLRVYTKDFCFAREDKEWRVNKNISYI